MLAIHAGKLIDGSGAAPRDNMLVLVDDGRILDVTPWQSATVPEGAELIDASAQTLMPGMIDAHVHLIWSGREDDPLGGDIDLFTNLPGTWALRAYNHAQMQLDSGFTVLRDVHSYDWADVALRNMIERGEMRGPRISAGGYGLTSTGGHMDARNGLREDVRLGYFNNVVDTPEEARRAVRFQVKMGVDHIKINVGRGYRIKGRPIRMAPEMRRDVLEAIIDEAHMAGRRVAGHSLGSIGELWAVEAGIDSLEHAHFIDDATIAAMAKHGTWLVPTMAHCVLNTRAIQRTLPQEKWANNLILNAYDSMYKVLPKALDAGVKVACGTDAGASNVPHGCSAIELELLTTAGMTNMQAIVAATRTSADLLDMADMTGQVSKGLLADLLIVEGDPLEDIRILQDHSRIQLVIKHGAVVKDRRTRKGA